MQFRRNDQLAKLIVTCDRAVECRGGVPRDRHGKDFPRTGNPSARRCQTNGHEQRSTREARELPTEGVLILLQ